jgi:O-antigen ligase
MKELLARLDNPRLNRLAFYTLLASGAFIILLWSPNVLGRHINHVWKIIIYITPWLMIWLVYYQKVITLKVLRAEILLIIAVIILGIINTALSDNVSRTLPQMRMFLLTGILALWTAMFLFTSEPRRRIFDWFCGVCLAIIVPVELIVRARQGALGPEAFSVFTLNPIPLGTLIILLSSGLLALLLMPYRPGKVAGGLLTSLAGALILLTTKRGALLALAAMLLGWMLLRGRRLRYLAVAVLLAAGLLAIIQGPSLVRRLNPNISPEFTILNRLELYPFALHVWQKHPIMGIGLRSFTQQQYLADYHQHITKLTQFPEMMVELHTFDNLYLTGFVELGTVMTLLYLALVILIVARYYRTLRVSNGATAIDWYRLLIILGVAVHSMTYDSLLFPPVNWLFHVQLGIMAGYYVAARVPAPAPAEAGLPLESAT